MHPSNIQVVSGSLSELLSWSSPIPSHTRASSCALQSLLQVKLCTSSPIKIMLKSWPVYLRIWPYLEPSIFTEKNQVKTRSLGQVLIKYDWCPYEMEIFGQRDMHRGKIMERNTGRLQPSTSFRERHGTDLSPHSPQEALYQHLDLGLLDSRAMRQ